MKRIFILIVLTIFTGNLFAQIMIPTDEQIKKFFKTKTMVVENQDPFSSYNEVMKEVMNKYWKVTPWEFLPADDFEENMYRTDYSFLVVSPVYIDVQQETLSFRLLNFLLNGRTRNINNLPDLGSFPILFEAFDYSAPFYLLHSIIQFMQRNIIFLSENPGMTPMKMLKYYNDNNDKVKNYELWVKKDQLEPDIDTEKEFKDVYDHKVKFVEEEELKEAVVNQNKNIAFLYKVTSISYVNKGRTIKAIFTTDGQLLYINQHKVSENKPDAFLAKDFKKLN